MAVGAVRRRSALLAVLVVALPGAGPLGAGALAALLVALGAPTLAPVLAAVVLAGAGALAGRGGSSAGGGVDRLRRAANGPPDHDPKT